jgi:hypothetical protein
MASFYFMTTPKDTNRNDLRKVILYDAHKNKKPSLLSDGF